MYEEKHVSFAQVSLPLMKVYDWKQRQSLQIHPTQRQRCQVLCGCLHVQGNDRPGEQRHLEFLPRKSYVTVFLLSYYVSVLISLLHVVVLNAERLMGNLVIWLPAAALHALQHVGGRLCGDTYSQVLQLRHESKTVSLISQNKFIASMPQQMPSV